MCSPSVEKMSHSHNERFAKPISGFKIFPQSSQISSGEKVMLLERGWSPSSRRMNEQMTVGNGGALNSGTHPEVAKGAERFVRAALGGRAVC